MSKSIRSAVLTSFVAILIVCGNGTPAKAEWNALPTDIIFIRDAPVYITEIAAYRTDDHDETMACVSFINVGVQEAKAVKFMVFETDAFGEVVRYDTLSIEGRFSPKIHIKVLRALNGVPRTTERCYDTFSTIKTQKIFVRLEQVLWIDGSVWTSPVAGMHELVNKLKNS